MARQNERNRYKYGICTNRDTGDGNPCPVCESKEVQKIRSGQEFVCPECKESLRQVPPPPEKKLWIYIIVAVLLIGGCALVGYLLLSNDTNSDKTFDNQVDSIEQTEISSTEPETSTNSEQQDDKTTLPPAPSDGADLGYAVWTGKVDANGLPNDTNGRMYFKERHRISPNDDLERYAEAGESIIGEYVNGKLIQGKWYKKDSNIESIILGN